MHPLFAHQRETIAFASTRPFMYDGSSPGTGKTRSVIEIYAMRRLLGAGCLLVLAPKSLLRSAWADDFRKYAPSLVTSVAYASNRHAAFMINADVYITNTDAVNWLAKQPDKFWRRFERGMLAVDEAAAFKHHTSQRSKALGRIANHFAYRHLQSGTPNANSITDLWHQYKILDGGKRLGSSFYQFRNNVCEPVQVGPMPNMVEWQDKEGITDVIADLVSDITIRHKFEDCIDIPENFVTTVQYHLQPRQLRVYKEMKELGLAQIAKDKLIAAINGAAVTTKLLQIASGAIYDGEGGYDLIDTGRYELVCDLIEARQHCVVFFLWKHQRDQLVEEFERRKITYCVIDGNTTNKQRSDAVAHFQAGFYKVCLAHPQSAAHGLTLTKGTTTIWVSPTYNLEHFLQGNQRIYRAGQTQRTETIMVIAPDTIEEGVAMKLQEKELRQGDLLALLEA